MNIINWQINTSNLGKWEEFQRLFSKYKLNLQASAIDLPEISADPLTVVAHKASQLDEFVLVDDTSLDIEGASVGINIRWLIDNLHEYIGRKAIWRVLLAYRRANEVYVFKGEVPGSIVPPSGSQGFGFDPVFLPENSNHTLADGKPDTCNARAFAVEALVKGDFLKIMPAIYQWDGPWQEC